METLIKKGTQDSNLKKNFLLRKLKKDTKNPKWENSMRKTLSDEWMLRLCMANLMNRQYDWEGWGLREPRDGLIPNVAPWWDGGKVDRLLVLGEQGLGDEILFASMFNDIDCPNITVECDRRLMPVFERSFPHIEFIGRVHYKEGFWGTDDTEIESREFDAQTLMGDLPTWYRRSIKDFPKEMSYLKPNPEMVYMYKTDCFVNGYDNVGVSWVGRQGRDNGIIKMGGVSLQYGEESDELHYPPFDVKNDIEALFAYISLLRKVISVPTTVVHIAGSLGIPCEVVMPKRGMEHGGFDKVNNSLNWRFHDTGSDWHPSVKIK